MNARSIINNAKNILIEKFKFKQKEIYKFVGCVSEFKNTKLLFSYELEINLKPIFLNILPTVKEIKGHIPKNPDYHINNDGSFCFGYNLTNKLIFDINLLDFEKFMEKNVKAFLYAVKHKDITGQWGAQEYSHNPIIAAREEVSYFFEIKTINKKNLDIFLNTIFSQSGKCYCGSNKLYKNCHKKKISKIFEYIDKFVIKEFIDDIKNNL